MYNKPLSVYCAVLQAYQEKQRLTYVELLQEQQAREMAEFRAQQAQLASLSCPPC